MRGLEEGELGWGTKSFWVGGRKGVSAWVGLGQKESREPLRG